jgi:hypothetical protein
MVEGFETERKEVAWLTCPVREDFTTERGWRNKEIEGAGSCRVVVGR